MNGIQASEDVKTYERREEVWNIATHLTGVLLAPAALAVLLTAAKGRMAVCACVLYVSSFFCLYLMSVLYHASVDPRRRKILRRLDHAAIYFLIGGTYTPLMLLCVGGTAGITVLSLVWLIAAVGIALEAFALKPFKGFSILMYLTAGWLCLSVIRSLYAGLTAAGLSFLVAGGVIYSAGIVFYVSRRVYAHAVWHVFVLAGSALHYGAVLSVLLSR